MSTKKRRGGVAHGGLRDVQCSHNLSGHLEHLLTLFPGDVGIEFHTQRRCQHLRGEIFGIFAGLLIGFPVRMVLGEIADTNRLRSFVSDLAITQNVISPGFSSFSPRLRGMILQFGGRMDETVTRLQ